MKTFSALFALAATIGLACTPAVAQPTTGASGPLWINPHGSVAVRTGACGDKLCGWVVWASKEAMDDARDSGVTSLIGTELLQDYRRNSAGGWTGIVYVPDMGRSFSSTITPVGANTIRVKGCLIGGFVCKSQVWQRIAKLPNA